MATLPVYNQLKEEVGSIEVADSVFKAEVNRDLFYEVIKWQLARRRSGTAHTKGRAQVRGGGKKPFKQKGTGRARQGSSRSPNHVGGGAVHGPKPRSYAYSLNKKMRRAALRSALSLRASEGRLIVVQDLSFSEIKTKRAASVFEKLAGSNAVVIDRDNLEMTLSIRNLPNVKYLAVEGLNLFDLLKYQHIVLTEPMVRHIEGAVGK